MMMSAGSGPGLRNRPTDWYSKYPKRDRNRNIFLPVDAFCEAKAQKEAKKEKNKTVKKISVRKNKKYVYERVEVSIIKKKKKKKKKRKKKKKKSIKKRKNKH